MQSASGTPVDVQASRDIDAMAVYQRHGLRPLWLDKTGAVRRTVLASLLSREQRLDPALAATPDALASLPVGAAPGNLDADRAWTRAFLAYLERRQGMPGSIPATGFEQAFMLLGQAAPADELELALLDLRMVQAVGGWRTVRTYTPPPPIPMSSAEATLVAFVTGDPAGMSAGTYDPAAPAKPRPLPVPETLEARLIQSNDLRGTDRSLDQAIQRFQGRHGLAVDGVVGPATLAALNSPVSREIAKIELNLARRKMIQDRGRLDRYVEVDVAGFELRLVENGDVVLRSRVIVGNQDTPTPIFDDRIRYVELNPFWYVPDSIMPELLEKEAAKPGYLSQHGYVWRDGGSRLVQKPGPENALGNYKFLFPNRHAVYLHDTAQRGLFGRSARSLSHGCVRVEKANELAQALLGPMGWSPARIDQALAEGKTRRIELSRTVPVFLDYRTAYVTDDGELQLRGDLYGHDAGGIGAPSSKGLAVARTVRATPRPRPATVPVTAAGRVPSALPTPSTIPAPSLPTPSVVAPEVLPTLPVTPVPSASPSMPVAPGSEARVLPPAGAPVVPLPPAGAAMPIGPAAAAAREAAAPRATAAGAANAGVGLTTNSAVSPLLPPAGRATAPALQASN